MEAIKAYIQIYNDFDGQEILKKIEACGRICYKSEDKITEGSAEKFVAAIAKRGHEAVLEHGSFIFETSYGVYYYMKLLVDAFETNHEFVSFLRFTYDVTPKVSGNVRAWRSFIKMIQTTCNTVPGFLEDFIHENPILFPEYQDAEFTIKEFGDIFRQIKVTDLETEHEKQTHWDVTVKFVVDRGVSHEIVRHRLASYCQESTRYCNYSQDKFANELTFIIPEFLTYGSAGFKIWKESMKEAEKAYFAMLNEGCTPQEARSVLPNSLKTELVMTANIYEWINFFKLRTSKAAHPQIREVAIPLLEDLKELIPVVFDDITYEKGGEDNGEQ